MSGTMRRNARYVFPRNMTATDRLAARSENDGECRIWRGSTLTDGYGAISIGGRQYRVHRLAWSLANGRIPDGMFIDHVCHNILCINVDHLRLATPAENSRNRAGAMRRNKTGVRGVCWNGKGYQAAVFSAGITYYLGTYQSVSDASRAARAARAELFGEFSGGA